MSYFTMLLGLALAGLGFYGKFGLASQSWTALIPVVFGLAFLTFGEGMRSMKKYHRLFLGLAIVLSLIGIAGTYKSAIQMPALLRGEELLRENGTRITLEAVAVQAAMLGACAVYLVIGLVVFFQGKKAVSNTPGK